ncbi:MAG TPA: tRNA dihydrouridine synthase DusB [Beijerinckiaceae bacterium]
MTVDHKLSFRSDTLADRLVGAAVLAPMSGVTDLGMRRLAMRFGATLVVSEMVASDQLVTGAEEARLKAEGEGIAPHVVQLAGCRADWLAEAARLAVGSGADVIDINMGCPAKRVVGGAAGSALMRDLDHALGLIEAVVAAVSAPVTVKMRLGWDDASLNAPELARRAEAAGVAALTIHGRTRQQFYKGTADWTRIAPSVDAVSIPVIANGDVDGVTAARQALAQSGAAGVMIGRAAVGRPWLVGEIAAALAGRTWRPPTLVERGEAAVEHYELLLHLFGREAGLRHARKHLAAYADHAAAAGAGLPGAERLALVTSDDPRQVTTLLRRAFAPRLADAA